MENVRLLARLTVGGATIAGALIGVTAAGASVHVAAPRAVHSHATGVVLHTYDVTTTSDSTLSGSAPVGTCHDTSNYGACSLRAAVQAADADFADSPLSWDVINVPAGTYNLSSTVESEPLYINDDGELTVSGAGPTKTIINAAALDNEIFDDTDNGDLSISGATLENGYGPVGGAIDTSDYTTVTVSNCAFPDDTAELAGGAIGGGEFGSIDVSNSSFSHDSAFYAGGAIYDDSAAQLVLSSDTFSHDSTTYNDSEDGGGGVWSQGPVEATNVSFQNDTSGADGGGLFSETGNITVTGGNFSGDDADAAGGGLETGANAIVKDVTFHGDDAVLAGGASATGFLGLYEDDTFSNDGTNGNGGDVASESGVTIDNSTSTHSTADTGGGSIASGGTLTMNDDTITDATMPGDDDGGGAVLVEGATASLTNVTVEGSTADSGYGGALNCSGTTLTVTGGNFDHDSADEGGAFALEDDCFANVDGTSFENDTSEEGGAIAEVDGVELVANDDTFLDNTSTVYEGGGIFMEEASILNLTNSTMAGNRADGSNGYGGAIGTYTDTDDASSVFLTNDTLTGNQAIYGGAMYGFESDFYITSSTIADNTLPHGYSGFYTGGIYMNSGQFNLTDTIVSGNTGDQCDTGVYDSGGYNLDSDNTCGLYANGDIVNHAATLGPLQNNGGPTETMLPLAKSLAIGNGGAACPASDQRGESVPAGASCDIGAVFVEAATAQLKAKMGTITKGAEQLETLTVTVTTKSATPSGTVAVKDGSKTVCVVTLGYATKGAASGTCSPGASTIGTGTASLVAVFGGGGSAAPATSSPATKVKVV